MSTNHDTTKDVKQADNSKLENVFHTKRKIVKYTHDGEWVDYCPSPITSVVSLFTFNLIMKQDLSI